MSSISSNLYEGVLKFSNLRKVAKEKLSVHRSKESRNSSQAGIVHPSINI